MCRNLINIKFFPANNGDCILIKVSDILILIDGGYINTYNEYLKPELEKLSSEGFSISHLIVSHIDGDHISGIIKLLLENENDQIIPIKNIWHNSHRHLQDFEHPFKHNIENTSGNDLHPIPVKSYLKEVIGEIHNISAEQGSSLGGLILGGQYNWNAEFNHKAVSVDNNDIIQINSEMTIRLLSPDNNKLKILKKFWERELYIKGYATSQNINNYDDAFEFLIAQEKERKIKIAKNVSKGTFDFEGLAKQEFDEDNSASNGSSISFVLEYANKKLLFLADSHPSLIVESLKKHYINEVFPMKFDLIKLSHHGSILNTSKELLDLIDSENYIISTDGSIFNHPNIETIARIIVRKNDFKRTLIFNYPIDLVRELNQFGLKEKYSYDLFSFFYNKPIEITI